MSNLTLYLMNQKGLAVLNAVVKKFGPKVIEEVVVARDKNVVNDHYDDIVSVCQDNNITWHNRTKYTKHKGWALAIGWRWMLSPEKLIVIHDSILPKKRGFAPLPMTLMNGDGVMGVTALLAGEGSYDTGPIIKAFSKTYEYPIKIQRAIEEISELYEKAAIHIVDCLQRDKLMFTPQNNKQATYSLWRDEQDYEIDWFDCAGKIKRHVDAVGYPYKGASSMMCGDKEKVKVRILDVTSVPDVSISGERKKQVGKVIFVEEKNPVIVCGSGLIRIDHMVYDGTQTKAVLGSFRSRFV